MVTSHHPLSPLRTLLLTEGILKLISGTIFILSPSTILKNLTSTPYSPVSTSLIRAFGTQTLAFTIPLLLAARGDTRSLGSRKIVYWACLAREGFLTVGLLGSMLALRWERTGRELNERAAEEGRVTEKRGREEDEAEGKRKLLHGMWLWVAELVPFVVGRACILGWRSDWFE